MTQYEIELDSDKSKRYIATPVWLRQDDSQDELKVILNKEMGLSNKSQLEFNSTKFDNQLIKDTDQSNFKIIQDDSSTPIGFIYTLPKELYQASGSTTATYFRIDGSSTSNFIIYVQRADGVGGTDSNSLISDVKSIINEMNSAYESMQEITSNATLDTAEIKKQIDDINSKISDITKLIDDNDVIKKSEAQKIITDIVNEMDLDTDDKISDPDVLAKIKTLGAV